ncbi:ExeM/NucH family extracellular endonuclease [Actibacterium mucosum]|nr:ExeM/NucH family extracellular endonuclease [Actibacterium mucosum]
MTVIFQEGFETDGNGTRYVTSVTEFTDGTGDFFIRTDGSNIGSFYQVAGQEGSSWFAVMDTDGEAPFATTLTMEFNDINIAGFSDLQISGLFAEDDDGSNQDWDADSLVFIEVSIDGGGFVKVLQFAATGGTNTEPGLDLDFDGTADSTLLTNTFQTFMADIAGTGALLDVRITVENLNAGDEDISFDDIQVTGTAAQTTVLNETFDDASGFTTSTGFFSDGGFDYFGITDGAGNGDFGAGSTPSGEKAITGNDGNYLVGMDLDGEGASLPVTVTWSDLDITGLTDLSFTGSFAEFFDNPGDIDAADFIRIEASIDGGPVQTVLEFRGADFSSSSSPSNGIFRVDTDGDGIGDGASLSEALAAFTAGIDGTGSSLDLSLVVSVNSGDEDFAVDNFQIVGAGGGTPQPGVIARAGDGVSVSEEGETIDTFTVELATTPSEGVTITIAAPDAQTLVSTDGVNFAASVQVNLSDTTPETITVKAVDDAVDETTPHTGNLTFTVSSGDNGYDGLAVNNLTLNIEDNDFSITKIHEVQGSGDASAMIGQEVTIEGIVVGTLTDGSGNISGYYLQEEDADADGDAATSEGIFVFAPGADVAVGDQIRVTGDVDEFNGLTELTNVSNSQTLQSGMTLPTATLITIGTDGYEAVEGMRVELVSGGEDPLTVITNFNLDRFGEVRVSEGTQTQPTQILDPETQQEEIQALIEANELGSLTIDDGSTAQNPDIYRLIDSGDGTPLDPTDVLTEAGPTLRLGTEVTSITGVMDERFGDYRLQADGPLDQVEGSNDRPTEAPEVGGDLKVASFNVLNFFTTLDEGSNGTGPNGDLNPRGADNAEELARQTAKIVAALVELDADIIGLQELENNGFGEGSAIATLVDALNAELGGEVYGFVDPGVDFVGTDAITTGLIYKIDEVSVAGADVLVFDEPSADTTFAIAEQIQAITNDQEVGDFDRNRPAVAATFVDENGAEITIAVNHFKSKGPSGLDDLLEDAINAGVSQDLIDALLADPNFDQNDGQGFWNQVRTDAAAELTEWLAGNPTGSTSPENVLILGDLNAYAKENPVSEITEDGFTDLAAEFIGEDAYSFVFDGQQGTLDYGLISGDLLDNVTGVAEWHINADEPDLLNYDNSFNNPAFFNDDLFASSDHDPLVIGITLDMPTVTTRFDFDTNDRGFFGHLITTVGDYAPDASFLPKFAKAVADQSAGLMISSAVDGAAPMGRPVQASFINGFGEGIGITTFGSDTFGPKGDARLIDGNEELIVDLAPTGDFGDADEIFIEFGTIRGEGSVTLEFYDEGELVDMVAADIVDGVIAYDLEGDASFDSVEIGVTDSLAVSITAIEVERFEADEFAFV